MVELLILVGAFAKCMKLTPCDTRPLRDRARARPVPLDEIRFEIPMC
jgi:hypothetical protein